MSDALRRIIKPINEGGLEVGISVQRVLGTVILVTTIDRCVGVFGGMSITVREGESLDAFDRVIPTIDCNLAQESSTMFR